MNLCFWLIFRRMVKTPAKTGFVCAQRLMENRTLIWWQGGKSMGTVQAPDAYTASWDLKKSNSENNVENWEYPKYVCTYTVLLFWLTCHGYSSHFLLVHRCKCEDLLLSRVLPTWLMQVLGFLHSGAVNATSHATRSASDAVDCVKATHPWCLAREVCWSWLTDISEIAKIHKIHRGTNKCIEVPLQ